MKRRAFIGAGLAAAAAPAAARAQIYGPGQSLNGQYLQQLTIGVNVTLSGAHGSFGQEVVKGVRSAVDEANKFNLLTAHVFGLRAFDDRDDAGQAAANVNIAASDPSIIGMVGNLTGPMTLAALSRYAQTNFALVVPTVTADAITARNYHNVYRLPTKDSTAGSLFARTFLHRGNNAIAVALDGNDYGYDAARGFVQQAHVERADADTIFFPKVILDPVAAAKAIQARSPDYVYFAGKSADLAPTASALRANGYTGDMGLSDGFYNADVASQYGTLLAGAVVASSMPPLARVPSITTLLSDFRNEVGSITAFSAYGYAAAQLIISASQRNNSTSRYTLLTTLQQGGTFTTLVGQFAFNLYGDPLVPNIYLYTLNKDGFTFLKPAIATGFVL